MNNKNQQNNEEWEEKFEEEIFIPHEPSCVGWDVFTLDRPCDCDKEETIKTLKEFIRQQRQEAYQAGVVYMSNFIPGIQKDAAIQAVREFAEDLKEEFPIYENKAEMNSYGNGYDTAIVNFHKAIDWALEVYGGK